MRSTHMLAAAAGLAALAGTAADRYHPMAGSSRSKTPSWLFPATAAGFRK